MGFYEISLATVVGINIILAMGLNLITGFCGQISLGHAAFYGIGAYAAALAAKAGYPLPMALSVGTITAGIAGIVVGLTSLRVKEDFLAITTMGVGFLFLGIVRQQEALGGELGISSIPSHGMTKPGFLMLIICLVVIITLWNIAIKKSWMGFAFEAVADDENTAKVLSVDAASYKLAAFAMGTALAGLAGGLYVYFARFIVPDNFGFITSISILSMVVVGGIGSVTGVFISTVLLTLMPEFFRFLSDYKLFVYGALLFSVMRFAPGGIAGLTSDIYHKIKDKGEKNMVNAGKEHAS